MMTAALASAVIFSQANAMGIDSPQGGMQLQSADPAQPKGTPRKKKPASEGKTKAPEKKSEQRFIDGYRHAHDLIYKRQDYAEAIPALRALHRDDHPDVANLIGFASRKLGRTEDAKIWYEKALAADPRHARTWQYYGMWHLERGERQTAERYLKRIESICGTGCEEQRSLKLALAGDGLVY
jgi:tetratricopeptide (TPR) repeat protein